MALPNGMDVFCVQGVGAKLVYGRSTAYFQQSIDISPGHAELAANIGLFTLSAY